MSKEALIAVIPSAWAAIAPAEGATKEIWHYAYRNAIWLNPAQHPPLPGGFEKCNVIGNSGQLQALLNQLDPADVKWNQAWEQGPGFDSLDFWPTDPATLETDVGADPSSIGHRFAGQSDRIYAGDFSDDYSGDFL